MRASMTEKGTVLKSFISSCTIFTIMLLYQACSPVLAEGTLFFLSEDGDSIGGGQEFTGNFENSNISLNQGAITITQTSSPFWSFRINTPGSAPILPGCYERAQRSPLQDNNRPGLDFSFDGAGCNTLAARYQIREFNVDGSSNQIDLLAIDFVQHCGGNGDALFGQIRFNSTIPTGSIEFGKVFTTVGNLSFDSAPGDFVGQGMMLDLPFTERQASVGRNFDEGISLNFSGEVTGIGNTFWGLDFAAPFMEKIQAGSFPGATRFPFQDDSEPGLNFGFDGRGCNSLDGEFTANNVAYDPVDDLPVLVDVDFVQYCEGIPNPPLSGSIQTQTFFANANPDIILNDGFESFSDSQSFFWQCGSL